MPTIQELQDRLATYRNTLSQMRVRYNQDGHIDEHEQRELDEMDGLIEQVSQQLEAALQRENNNNSNGNGSGISSPIVFTETRQRTWWWELNDSDWFGSDLGARFELNVQFGKVVRGSQYYWVISGVTPSFQTYTGITLEPSDIKSVYMDVGGKLIIELHIQLKIKTADVSVSSTSGVGFTLNASDKQTIGAALPVDGVNVSAGHETGVSAGFSYEKQWTRSQNLPGSVTTITRRFKCTNNNGSLNIVLDYKNNVLPSAIDDVPGIDYWSWDSADWQLSDNDSSFAGSL